MGKTGFFSNLHIILSIIKMTCERLVQIEGQMQLKMGLSSLVNFFGHLSSHVSRFRLDFTSFFMHPLLRIGKIR